MRFETVDRDQMSDILGELRQELTRLGERVAALEAADGTKWGLARQDAVPVPILSPPATEGLSEELILVISAAIAAFLGKKPHIRQIRLLSTATWAQQGRVMIQASHDLPVRHG
jgi:methylmalonyl-CoA carboxyltransferase large subunit